MASAIRAPLRGSWWPRQARQERGRQSQTASTPSRCSRVGEKVASQHGSRRPSGAYAHVRNCAFHRLSTVGGTRARNFGFQNSRLLAASTRTSTWRGRSSPTAPVSPSCSGPQKHSLQRQRQLAHHRAARCRRRPLRTNRRVSRTAAGGKRRARDQNSSTSATRAVQRAQ